MANIITPILKPFANNRLTGAKPNTLPNLNPGSPDTIANQSTGFPLVQADPLSTDGIPVKESEMNGVLYFYTNLLYQQGLGYQYTFDANLSAAVGGYPLGVILYCDSNNSYQKSLKDGNTANFVTTPSYINDGTNWQQILFNPSTVFPDIADNVNTGEMIIGNRVDGQKITITTRDPIHNTYTQSFWGNDGSLAYMNQFLCNADGSTNTGIEYIFNHLPSLSGQNISSLLKTINSIYYFGAITYNNVINGSTYYTIVTILNADGTKNVLVSGTTQVTMTNPPGVGANNLPLGGVSAKNLSKGAASTINNVANGSCFITINATSLTIEATSNTSGTYDVSFSITFIAN